MRLTVHADYSLRLLIFLGAKQGQATIPEVAESYGISLNHLVKVAHRLGLQGYIATTRGKNGGLRLARPADQINIGDVVRVVEPDMALVPCLAPVHADCPIYPSCVLHTAIEKARGAFLEVLDGYTLADLVNQRSSLQILLGITPVSNRPLPIGKQA